MNGSLKILYISHLCCPQTHLRVILLQFLWTFLWHYQDNFYVHAKYDKPASLTNQKVYHNVLFLLVSGWMKYFLCIIHFCAQKSDSLSLEDWVELWVVIFWSWKVKNAVNFTLSLIKVFKFASVYLIHLFL